MLHRNTQGKKDFHLGKWNGLGGKFEKDESPLEAAVREFYEESGLKIKPDLFSSLGVITFPNFKPKKSEDWCCFIFSVQISKKDRAKKLKSKPSQMADINECVGCHCTVRANVKEYNFVNQEGIEMIGFTLELTAGYDLTKNTDL
jgi:ADP-ribose pyrophosphatase YjhB (NUDIX family)